MHHHQASLHRASWRASPAKNTAFVATDGFVQLNMAATGRRGPQIRSFEPRPARDAASI